MSVCILDYGSGNVGSVFNALRSVTDKVLISNRISDIQDATHLILPGVGSFGAAMQKINEKIPREVVETEVFKKGKPFLGICVGLQVLAERGMEFGDHQGLGWLKGVSDKLDSHGSPLPHIGWNNIQTVGQSPLLVGLNVNHDFYFLHTFAFRASNVQDVVATCVYGEEFSCVLSHGNIYGVQFHPEKSQRAGKILFQNFLRIVS